MEGLNFSQKLPIFIKTAGKWVNSAQILTNDPIFKRIDAQHYRRLERYVISPGLVY